MADPKTHDDFADEIPVDWPRVIAEARQYRENYSARESWEFALQRDRALRLRKSYDAFTASISPVERERRALQVESDRLRDKLLGARAGQRQFLTERLQAYSARLAELDRVPA